MANMQCKNCNEMGHKAADCEQPRKVICKNCDDEGHVAKDCTKPKDWSRVKCSNCQQSKTPSNLVTPC